MKKIPFILIYLLIYRFGVAQNFRYESGLPAIDSSGFYKIQVPPEINSKLKTDFSDLRLNEDKQMEVPYLLKDESSVKYLSSFKEYQIVDRIFSKDSITQIILKNESGERINNISLLIRNADVRKDLKLTGSFDRKQWFVVKEYESISSLNNEKEIAEIKLINFPLSNYSFYKIELNDKHSAPVDVLKAGYYESTIIKGQFTELKSQMSITDSLKQKVTWAQITFEDTLSVDEIEFTINGPLYYLRPVDLFYSIGVTKTKNKIYFDRITLDSKSSLRFDIGRIKVKEMWFKIYNEDSPLLKISTIRCFQLNHYCLAYLEKGKQYQLRFGDSLLTAPNYDIKYFQSVIPQSNLKILYPGKVAEIKQEPKRESMDIKSIWNDKRFVWAALLVVILLLGFVTFRLMRDMN